VCGIAGIICEDEKPVDAGLVKRMTDIIAHRGPNSEGFYIDRYIGLGHRRLAIVDLSESANQPMKYVGKNGEYIIVYNGEIYNYVELKEVLKEEGYLFNTHSDTEVILASYDKWGLKCVEKFNGIWAFAIYDKRRNILFLSRDRFGVKPLYYTKIGNKFLFASEIKQFTVVPGWKAKANEKRVYDYLAWGGVDHTEETLYEGVNQLRGGHNLVYYLDRKKFEIQRWYDLRIEKENISYEDAKENFRKLVFDAVRLQLRSDVKVGSCLSGGLDSSTIVSVMKQILGDNGVVETVTACSEYEKFDERKYADEVTAKMGFISHKVFPRFEELFKELNGEKNEISRITWYQDGPTGSTSALAQYSVFRKARQENIVVMLDGQGADEILAGYQYYKPVYISSLLRRGKIINYITELKSMGDFKTSMKFALESIGLLIASRFVQRVRRALLKGKFFKLSNGYSGPFIDFSNFTSFSYDMVFKYSLPALLHWEDRDSMAFSIESRVPFLDHRIVEFLFSLPEDYIISNGKTKRILRDAMRGVVPDKILDRKDKLGFATPEEIWVRKNRDLMLQKIDESIRLSKGLIKPEFKAYAQEVLNNPSKKYDFMIWRVVNFGEWLKVFDVHIDS
jgi:asparagine synthase (glutamine-hydrolysing)